jgi:hypothetical protein
MVTEVEEDIEPLKWPGLKSVMFLLGILEGFVVAVRTPRG